MKTGTRRLAVIMESNRNDTRPFSPAPGEKVAAGWMRGISA